MTGEDAIIWQRMVRRLRSARASVMFEFALVAPLVIIVGVFAADFTRILRTEQQLEIAARLGADVEAHMADYYGSGKCPSDRTKSIAKCYLADVAHVAQNKNIFMKGSVKVTGNPVSYLANGLMKFMSGEGWGSDNWFFKLLGMILGSLANFFSFGTSSYITDVLPHDRQAEVSMAAYIPTIVRAKSYEWLGIAHAGRKMPNGREAPNLIGVGQFEYDLDGDALAGVGTLTLNPLARHRVYCVMPVMDSVPIAPETYIRKVMTFFQKIFDFFGI